MRQLLIVLFLVSLLAPTASASVFETRTPILGWQSIKTEHFEVIYPPGAEAHAQRVAATLEALHESTQIDERKHLWRLPVVLASDGSISNGYAAPFPRHSTLYVAPVADIAELDHTLNWLDLLSIHEYRHNLQHSHINRGFPRLVRGFAGPLPSRIVTAYVLPNWYFEGDAVLTETAFTDGGRGRAPAFDVGLRALTAERGVLSYDQYLSGSIRYPIPDHYKFGYHMISYGREAYGADVWRETIQRTAAWSPMPFVFPLNVKRTTGKYLRDYTAEVMEARSAQWALQREQTRMTVAEDVMPHPTEGYAVSTRSPHPQPNGSVIAYQEGSAIAPRIVQIEPGGEVTTLVRTGARQTSRISVAAGAVVWDEIAVDPVRRNRTYSVIRVYGSDGQVRNLTTKDRHFSPALSPDGRAVAAVLHTPENTPALVVLDAETGEETWRLDYPVHHWIRTPTWAPDGQSLALVHLTDHDGVGIEIVDIDSKVRTTLVEPSHTRISKPSLSADYLFYTSAASGLDAVWAVALSDGAGYRVASRPFAAQDPMPSLDGESVYFTDYHYLGTGIQRVALDPAEWEAEDDVVPVIVDTISPTVAQTDGKVSFGPPEEVLPSKRYLRIPRVRDAVVWRMPLDKSGGFIWLADPTSLVELSLNAGLDEDNRAKGHVDLTYNGLPVSLSGQIGSRQRFETLAEISESPEASVEEEPAETGSFTVPDWNTSWKEKAMTGAMSLPLSFSRGAWLRRIELSGSGSLREVSDLKSDGQPVESISTEYGNLEEGVRKEISGSAYFYQAQRSAPMAMASRWSQSLYYSHTITPFGGDLQGSYQAAEAGFSFPGLSELHSLLANTSWQYAEGDYVPLPTVFSPHDYTLPANGGLVAGGIKYLFPIAYPDKSFTPLAFLNGLYGGLFYEVAQEQDAADEPLIQALGVELWTVGDLIRQSNQMRLKLEAGWRIDTAEPFVVLNFRGEALWSSSDHHRTPMPTRRR